MVVIHKDIFFANIPGVEHGDCHLDLYLPDQAQKNYSFDDFKNENDRGDVKYDSVDTLRNLHDDRSVYDLVEKINVTDDHAKAVNKKYSNDEFFVKDDSENVKKKDVPFVLFIHGGGWRRGGRSAWKHYLYFDVNFVVAFLQFFVGSYGNIGEVLAENNIACAIVSYPLTEARPVVVLVEMFLSYIQSVFFVFATSSPVLGLLLIYKAINHSSFDITCEIIFKEKDSCNIFRTLFLIAVIFTNFITALLFFIRRKEFNISIIQIRLFGVALSIVSVLSFCSNSSFYYLVISTLVLTQSMIFCQRIRRHGCTYDGQVRAVAQAVRWAKCFGEESRRIDNNRLYLMGHSAGGHLATLLAMDESILEEVTCSTQDVKGVISISGVYDLLCLNKHWLRHVYLEPTFGRNFKHWLQASPEHLAQRKNSSNTMPKFLLMLAENDVFLKSQSYKFAQTLDKSNFECEHVEISKSNHFSIVTNTSTDKGSAMSYIINFVK